MDDFLPQAPKRRNNKKISKDVIIPVENKASSAINVPRLDLQVAQSSAASSDGSQKRSIASLAALKNAASTHLTARRNTLSGAAPRNLPTRSGGSHNPSSETHIPATLDPVVLGSPKKAPSILPRVMERSYSAKILLQEEKTYSESEIWEKLKTFNATLYAFGQKYHMDLDTLESYALFAQEYDVHPTVIAEHIRGANLAQETNWWQKAVDRVFGSSGDEQRFNHFNEHFERIKKENPENFGALVLELMKNTDDQANGMNHKSQIDSMHSTLLTQENSDQLHQIRAQYLAMILQFIAGVGATAWALYGQVSPAAGNVTAT